MKSFTKKLMNATTPKTALCDEMLYSVSGGTPNRFSAEPIGLLPIFNPFLSTCSGGADAAERSYLRASINKVM